MPNFHRIRIDSGKHVFHQRRSPFLFQCATQLGVGETLHTEAPMNSDPTSQFSGSPHYNLSAQNTPHHSAFISLIAVYPDGGECYWHDMGSILSDCVICKRLTKVYPLEKAFQPIFDFLFSVRNWKYDQGERRWELSRSLTILAFDSALTHTSTPRLPSRYMWNYICFLLMHLGDLNVHNTSVKSAGKSQWTVRFLALFCHFAGNRANCL